MPALSQVTTGSLKAESKGTTGTAYLPPQTMEGERVTTRTLPEGVRVLVQQSTEAATTRPLNIVIYTLPNGNTLEQTFGRAEAPGQDWHYQIQHIGAQLRRVQELLPSQQFTGIYLEAEGKSWPTWRKTHSNNLLIRDIVDGFHQEFGSSSTVTLASHSGGGSFIFGFLDAVDDIPSYINRIAFLDSNYGFSVESGHAAKLHRWLQASTGNHLVVLAYDDRRITINGKLVLSPTGGTYRSTSRMSAAFETSVPLKVTTDRDFITTSGLDGRLLLQAHSNSENKILHTVLVERNGFVQALTTGTNSPTSNTENYYGEPSYRKWIR